MLLPGFCLVVVDKIVLHAIAILYLRGLAEGVVAGVGVGPEERIDRGGVPHPLDRAGVVIVVVHDRAVGIGKLGQLAGEGVLVGSGPAEGLDQEVLGGGAAEGVVLIEVLEEGIAGVVIPDRGEGAG